jgi:hypothetical protein
MKQLVFYVASLTIDLGLQVPETINPSGTADNLHAVIGAQSLGNGSTNSGARAGDEGDPSSVTIHVLLTKS